MKRIAVIATVTIIGLVAIVLFLFSEEKPPGGVDRSAQVGKKSQRAIKPLPTSTPSTMTATTTAKSANPLAGFPHTTPPAELPNGRVKDYLPGLLQNALGPNPSADAALSAYLALNACKSMAAFGTPSVADTKSDSAMPNIPNCSGISEKDWADTTRLLKIAADLGSERAQLAYARKMPLDGKTLDDFVQKPEELVEFKNDATRYLMAASEAGNLDAMWFLSESLRTGDLIQKDIAAAYQYKYAISRAGGYPQYINDELSKLESQLSPEEVRAAQDNANRFLERCCNGKSVNK